MADVLNIVAAAIMDSRGQMLLVRKKGTEHFMQPGGKIDAGETPQYALVRELQEELDFRVTSAEFTRVGVFEAQAANEENTIVQAEIYKLQNDGPFEPRAEIAELLWYPSEFTSDTKLAPLTRDCVIPACEVVR